MAGDGTGWAPCLGVDIACKQAPTRVKFPLSPHRFLQHLPALTLALVGVAIILVGRSYNVGTLTNMGPGFMPVLGGIVLLALVLAQVFTDRDKAAPGSASPGLRALLLCTGSILVWAMLAEPAGVIPASLLQLLLANAAVPQASWKVVLAISAFISVAVYVVFVVLLGVPLRALA